MIGRMALAATLLTLAASGCGRKPSGTATRGGTPMPLQATSITMKSTAFSEGGDIPAKYTCDGANVSPDLSWSPLPASTKSIALLCDDPDAPRGTWVHWVVYDLPPSTLSLPEGVPATEDVRGGGTQGKSSFGKIGYGGPCPPPGPPHRYFFKLYALDTVLGLGAGKSKADAEKAMQGHVVAQGELMGRYARS